MPTLSDIRRQYPGAYDDMSDDQLADALHRKFYSDVPREQFNSKIGLGAEPLDVPQPAEERPFLERAGRFVEKVRENPPPFLGSIARGLAAPGRAVRGEFDVAPEGLDPNSEEAAYYRSLAGQREVEAARDLATVITPGVPRGTGGILARPTARAPSTSLPLPPVTQALAPTPAPSLAPSTVQGALEAAGRLGVDIPRYLATEGSTIPQLTAGIKNVPGAGEPIVKSAGRLLEKMGGKKAELAPGAASPELAGSEAKERLAGWITKGSQSPVNEAYKKVDSLIDPDIRMPLNKTSDTVAQLAAERARAKLPGKSKAIDAVFEAVQSPDGMDYAGVKGLRTFLGEKTPQEIVAAGISPVEHKRVYAALTQDLGDIIREAGGAEAFAAWQEANTLARLTSRQRTSLAKIIGTKADASPEAVFSRLSSYAGSKSSADIRRLRLAKGTMGPQAWNDVGAAIVTKLGSDTQGRFSADRFVTGFGSLSTEAKKELFNPEHLAALNDLYTVSKLIQDRITGFANPSGTARALFGGSLIWWLLFEPMSLVASMVGGRALAEALSRPAAVKATADVGRAVLRSNQPAARAASRRLHTALLRAGLISTNELMRPTPPEPSEPSPTPMRMEGPFGTPTRRPR